MVARRVLVVVRRMLEVVRRVLVTTGRVLVTTRRVLVTIRRVLVTIRRVLVATGAEASPHLPARQVMSPSQSFSVVQGSPEGKVLGQCFRTASPPRLPLSEWRESKTHQRNVRSTRRWDWKVSSA
jgi:hypothetical protein